MCIREENVLETFLHLRACLICVCVYKYAMPSLRDHMVGARSIRKINFTILRKY